MPYTIAMKNHMLQFIWGEHANLPRSVQIGLSLTKPAEDGTNVTEPSDGYIKVNLDSDTDFEIDYSSGEAVAVNLTQIDFPQATGDWGEIPYWTLYVFALTGPQYTLADWGYIDDGAGTPTPLDVSDTDEVLFLPGELRMFYVLPPSEVP